MEQISFDFIVNAVQGKVVNAGYKDSFCEITTDTRKIIPGSVFLALAGERFDGNDFLEQAFDRGAAVCIAERPCDKGTVIVVRDTHAALILLARAYRELFELPVVGVTGSVGKTSTKEMICCVLSQRFKTHKNEGNFNNEIGMPLSVFGLSREHSAAVFEMGMSGFGEISRLSKVAQPSVAVITNIGISHIEKLGSQQNILRAKLEILDGLKEGGRLVINGDDRLLKSVRATGVETYTYGIESEDCGVYADNISMDQNRTAFTIHFDGDSIRAELPVCGRHNIYNALASFLCGRLLGLRPDEIVSGFKTYVPSGLRQRIEVFSGITLIKDCYNASPDSMSSAFDVLKTVQVQGRRIAVLADMLELGASAKQAHLDVGSAACASGVDILLTFGENARYYCEGFGNVPAATGRRWQHFDDKAALSEALAGIMKSGDAVLFKGSRGMKLEETIEKACERWNIN